MGEVVSELSERDIADLCALADGTLPDERRAEVEARVAASPGLQELVDRQRRSLARTAGLASEPVPESLREGVEAQRRSRRSRGPSRPARLPRIGLAGGLAAAAVAFALVISGGSAGPTVADAAALTERPPTGPAPAPSGDGAELAEHLEGVAFPNLRPPYGWRTVGVRRDRVDGRRATIVYYAKGGRRLAYVIVGGSALDRPGEGSDVVRGGVRYQSLRLNGRPAVTWRRGGRTCVLVGGASAAELLALARY
jgi:anti-sigma factor RsiW